jgi:hypothetical protein
LKFRQLPALRESVTLDASVDRRAGMLAREQRGEEVAEMEEADFGRGTAVAVALLLLAAALGSPGLALN